MKLNIFYFLIPAVVFTFNSCEPTVDDFSPSKGNADFSKYVALGNSLTAGYADGALYLSGQENSYPSIIAGQLKSSGFMTSDFKQPLMLDEYGFSNIVITQPIPFNGGVKFRMGVKTDCLGDTDLSPVYETNAPNMANMASIANQGPFQNLGVPGAKVSHLLATKIQNPNPYFQRFATTDTSSVLSLAMAQVPSFFSLWIGNNDVLGYATAGGGNGGNSITPSASFTTYYGMIVGGMVATGAKGVLINIPAVTSTPFFTTVPNNGIELEQTPEDTIKRNMLNAAYGNGALGISFAIGKNFWVIQDTTRAYPYQFRQIKSNEYLLLTVPQDSLKCAGWGTAKPIPHQYVLDTVEVAAIMAATAAYNATIAQLAETNGLALADVNTFMNQIKQNGLMVNGKRYTSTFVSGGIFSLDGIHLSKQGNAIVANYIIDAINAKYGSTIPKVDPNSYPGIAFPELP